MQLSKLTGKKKLALNSQLSFHVSTVDRGPKKDDVFHVWQNNGPAIKDNYKIN